MPLELNDKQVLPDGIHDADMEEIERLFGQFQRSTRRSEFVKRLRDYVIELRKAGLGESLIIDGSFIMGCIDEPEDIDIVLVLADNWDMKDDLRPFEYNLISRRDIKRHYPFGVFVVTRGSEIELELLEYFSQVNTKWYEFGFDDESTKGLVRIVL